MASRTGPRSGNNESASRRMRRALIGARTARHQVPESCESRRSEPAVSESNLPGPYPSPRQYPYAHISICEYMPHLYDCHPHPGQPPTPATRSYVALNDLSSSQRRNDPLSLNCLNSSVWSASSPVIARSSALSCSMRAFCLSELTFAF